MAKTIIFYFLSIYFVVCFNCFHDSLLDQLQMQHITLFQISCDLGGFRSLFTCFFSHGNYYFWFIKCKLLSHYCGSCITDSRNWLCYSKWTHQWSRSISFDKCGRTCSELSTDGWSINWENIINIGHNHNSPHFCVGHLACCVSVPLFSLCTDPLVISQQISRYLVILAFQVLWDALNR